MTDTRCGVQYWEADNSTVPVTLDGRFLGRCDREGRPYRFREGDGTPGYFCEQHSALAERAQGVLIEEES